MATYDSKDLLVAVKAFARGNALPLDKDEIWESLDAAQAYVASPTAYAGQTIKVLIGDKYKTYTIQPSGSSLALEELSGGSGGSTVACVQVVESLPESGQIQGVIYINVSDNNGYIWTGSDWKIIFSDTSVEISELKTLVNAKANLDGATFTGSVILAADPTQDKEAVTKQYVDRLIGEIVSSAPGVVDASNPLPEEHKAGQTWRVAEVGTYANKKCEVGDLIICVADGSTIDENNFIVVQANIDGAVTGPDESTDGHIVVFDGLTGKIIKDSTVSIDSLNDAIEKAHEHTNKGILDSFTKTETELLNEVDSKINDAKSALQSTIDKKADSDTVYTKVEIDNTIQTINNNLNSKVSAEEVTGIINDAIPNIESGYQEYVNNKIGEIGDGKTVKDYVDAAVGSGGADVSAAIEKAKQEAITASNAYTDTSLTITEF